MHKTLIIESSKAVRETSFVSVRFFFLCFRHISKHNKEKNNDSRLQ